MSTEQINAKVTMVVEALEAAIAGVGFPGNYVLIVQHREGTNDGNGDTAVVGSLPPLDTQSVLREVAKNFRPDQHIDVARKSGHA